VGLQGYRDLADLRFELQHSVHVSVALPLWQMDFLCVIESIFSNTQHTRAHKHPIHKLFQLQRGGNWAATSASRTCVRFLGQMREKGFSISAANNAQVPLNSRGFPL